MNLPADFSPLGISIRTALLSTVIVFFIGIAAAKFLYKHKQWRGFLDSVFTLPMVLPPTVVGFFLLILLGQNGPLNPVFKAFDIQIIFSWPATVIAAVVVSFPMMYRTTLGALDQLDPNLANTARTLGFSEGEIFWRIELPNARPGLLAGTVLAFARGLGEFGATMMIAGNVPKVTQTMSVAVYAQVQAGNRGEAYFWSLLIVSFSDVMMFILNRVAKKDWRSEDGTNI